MPISLAFAALALGCGLAAAQFSVPMPDTNPFDEHPVPADLQAYLGPGATVQFLDPQYPSSGTCTLRVDADYSVDARVYMALDVERPEALETSRDGAVFSADPGQSHLVRFDGTPLVLHFQATAGSTGPGRIHGLNVSLELLGALYPAELHPLQLDRLSLPEAFGVPVATGAALGTEWYWTRSVWDAVFDESTATLKYPVALQLDTLQPVFVEAPWEWCVRAQGLVVLTAVYGDQHATFAANGPWVCVPIDFADPLGSPKYLSLSLRATSDDDEVHAMHLQRRTAPETLLGAPPPPPPLFGTIGVNVHTATSVSRVPTPPLRHLSAFTLSWWAQPQFARPVSDGVGHFHFVSDDPAPFRMYLRPVLAPNLATLTVDTVPAPDRIGAWVVVGSSYSQKLGLQAISGADVAEVTGIDFEFERLGPGYPPAPHPIPLPEIDSDPDGCRADYLVSGGHGPLQWNWTLTCSATWDASSSAINMTTQHAVFVASPWSFCVSGNGFATIVIQYGAATVNARVAMDIREWACVQVPNVTRFADRQRLTINVTADDAPISSDGQAEVLRMQIVEGTPPATTTTTTTTVTTTTNTTNPTTAAATTTTTTTVTTVTTAAATTTITVPPGKQCPPGTYRDRVATGNAVRVQLATSFGPTVCVACPAGTVSPHFDPDAPCSPCRQGHQPDPLQAACVASGAPATVPVLLLLLLGLAFAARVT